jgi:hypothetical protein
MNRGFKLFLLVLGYLGISLVGGVLFGNLVYWWIF